MSSCKLLVSLIVVGGLMSSCAFLPPIPIGPDALGERTQEFDMATETIHVTTSFADTDKPTMPVAPSSFRSVRGFEENVIVYGGPYPKEIVLTANSGLEVTIEDTRANPPAPVVARAPFGPLTLAKSAECADLESQCPYTFTDPEAAAVALTVEIEGDDFSRLLDIIFEDGTSPNTMSLDLTIKTDRPFTRMKFTVTVVENYIKL